MAKLNDFIKLIEQNNTGAWPGVSPVTTTFLGSAKPTTNDLELKLTPDQIAKIDNVIDQSPNRNIHNATKGNAIYHKSGKNWAIFPGNTIMDPKIINLLNQFQQQNQSGTTQPTTQQPTTQQPATNISTQAIAKVDEIYQLYTANNTKPPTEILSLLAEIRRKFQSQSIQPTKESQEFQRIINLSGLK